jgi:hypothetical protein
MSKNFSSRRKIEIKVYAKENKKDEDQAGNRTRRKLLQIKYKNNIFSS